MVTGISAIPIKLEALADISTTAVTLAELMEASCSFVPSILMVRDFVVTDVERSMLSLITLKLVRESVLVEMSVMSKVTLTVSVPSIFRLPEGMVTAVSNVLFVRLTLEKSIFSVKTSVILDKV